MDEPGLLVFDASEVVVGVLDHRILYFCAEVVGGFEDGTEIGLHEDWRFGLMAIKYDRTSVEGSLKRRNNNSINVYIFHLLPSFQALLNSCLGNFWVEIVLAELVGKVLL